MSHRHATLPTPLGDLLVVADEDGLTGIYFPSHWHPPIAGSIGEEVDARGDALFARLGEELAEYLDGRRTEFDLPTSPAGDDFQHAVWTMLREIPYGETTSYGELAAASRRPQPGAPRRQRGRAEPAEHPRAVPPRRRRRRLAHRLRRRARAQAVPARARGRAGRRAGAAVLIGICPARHPLSW